MAGNRLAAQERALEVDAQHAIEIGFLEIEELAAGEDAGIVDQHIDAAEGIDGGGEQVVHVEPFADIAFDEADRTECAEILHRA